MNPEDLRAWIRFGSRSPVYERLVEVIAEDPDLLAVLNRIEHLPQPNLLFAGVQYLLLQDPTVPLASHYPNLARSREPEGKLDDVFREFVFDHEEKLIEIGRTRYTQTNECRRCSVLVPLIWLIPVTRFHLVDVGASAGLNLHLDRYQYSWGDVGWGRSTVKLETANRGAPIVPREMVVMSRIGLDLNPVDPADSAERMWLEALIWPEHNERRRRLRAALELAGHHRVDLVVGDAVETISPVLAGLPSGEPIVVMHSFTLNQLDSNRRETFRQLLQDHRSKSSVYQVGFEAIGRNDGAAGLTFDDGSGSREVGLAHPHGEWVDLTYPKRNRELYARP